jgi:hypothetical protein
MHRLRVCVERFLLRGNIGALLDPVRQQHVYRLRLRMGVLGHGGVMYIFSDANSLSVTKGLQLERLRNFHSFLHLTRICRAHLQARRSPQRESSLKKSRKCHILYGGGWNP